MREDWTHSRLAVSALAFIAGFGVVWGGAGDLSEGARRYNDPPMFDLPNGTGAVQVAALLLGGAAAVAALLLLGGTVGRSKTVHVRLAVALFVYGGFLALSERVVASRTEGANIGGGLLLLVVPVVSLVLVSYCAAVIRRER